MFDLYFLYNSFNICMTYCLYISGSQSVVRGPPGVPEGVPGGPQLNDGLLPDGPLQLCDSEIQMEPKGPVIDFTI